MIHTTTGLGRITENGSFNPSYLVERPDIVNMVPNHPPTSPEAARSMPVEQEEKGEEVC